VLALSGIDPVAQARLPAMRSARTLTRRLGLTAAIALTATAIAGRRRTAFELDSDTSATVQAPRALERCTCDDCIRADLRDAYGYFQWRLPLSGGSWR
jgi:hypothetical protein